MNEINISVYNSIQNEAFEIEIRQTVGRTDIHACTDRKRVI